MTTLPTLKVDTPAGRPTAVPPLQVVVETHGRTAALFGSASERNTWYRNAFQAMGNYWLNEYLPLRFNRGYASGVMGYAIGGGRPFEDTGLLKAELLKNARAEATATATKQEVSIILPPGRAAYVNYNRAVLNGLRILPARELKALAPALDRELRLGLLGAKVITAKRGRTAGAIKLRFKADGAASNIVRRAELTQRLNRSLGLKPQGLRAKSRSSLAPLFR